MRKSPQLVLIALAATVLVPNLRVFGQAIVAVEENGRKVYVNDVATVPEAAPARRQATYRLVYWSQTERRWKPVPGAKVMTAARTAAAEVRDYLGMSGETAAKAKGASGGAARPAFTAAQIEAAIQEAASRHRVDPNLVRAVVKVESNFNPRAVSPKGAMGLMQLMPGTARDLAVQNPFDPQQNVDAGVRHLKGLLDNFGGNVPLTLAAYNAGAKAVQRNKGIPPYAETRQYVERITKLYGNGSAVKLSELGPQIHVTRGPNGVLFISNTD